jgi:plasmid stabilization system protein ParE
LTFTVRFSSNAERDFLRAQTYYDEVAPHQTDRFVAEVFSAARVLVDHIEIGRVISGDVRRWQLGVFPYQLWYRVNHERVVVRIIAVVGDAQDHQRFADRLM